MLEKFSYKTSKISWWCSIILFINNEAELKAYQITLRQVLDPWCALNMEKYCNKICGARIPQCFFNCTFFIVFSLLCGAQVKKWHN